MNIKSKFILESGVLVASDPCYQLDSMIAYENIFENVMKGVWIASVQYDENKDIIRSMKISNESGTVMLNEEDYVDIAVDSGQFGFFDRKYYYDDESVSHLPKKSLGTMDFYNAMCYITLESDYRFGTTGYGVVSSSNGDGTYKLIGRVGLNNEYVEFEIKFI